MSLLKTWLPPIVWADTLLNLVAIAFIPQYPKWMSDFTPMFEIRFKYPIGISPYLPMVVTTWVTQLAFCAASYVVFSRGSPKIVKLFPMAHHIFTFPAMAFCVPPWIFIYSHEKFFLSAAILFISAVVLCISLVTAAKKRASVNVEPGSNELWWYDRTVLDGPTTTFIWYSYASVTFGLRSLLYKDGPSDVAQPRGLCDPNSECALYLMPFYVVYVLAWLYLDLYYCPNYTKNIKVLYPMMIYTSLAILIPLYPFENDILVTHKIHMIITAVAFLAGVFRHSLQKSFSNVKKVV